MLAKAKKAGETPISFGNLDKFGGIHEFQTVQNQFADKQATRNFVFAKDGASFDTSENKEAATKLQDVGQEGLLHEGLQRHRLRPGLAAVHQGQGPVHDRRHLDHLRRAQGARRQARLLPDAGPRGGREPVSLGGESLPWAITSKSKNADVAAAYIDFLTNAKAADVQVETGNLPAMQGDRAATAPAAQDIFTAWKELNDTDGLTPYMDYATPTFYDDFSGAVQKLLAGKTSPDAFTKSVQADYAKFTDTL